MIMLIEIPRGPWVNRVYSNIPITNRVGLATNPIMTLTFAGILLEVAVLLIVKFRLLDDLD
jgi:hypothetical protein